MTMPTLRQQVEAALGHKNQSFATHRPRCHGRIRSHDAVTGGEIRIPPTLPETGGRRNSRPSLQDLDPIVEILELRLQGMFAGAPFTVTETVNAVTEKAFDGPQLTFSIFGGQDRNESFD